MEAWPEFSQRLHWAPGAEGPAGLRAAVEKAEAAWDGERTRLHYLSVPPKAALSVVETLQEADLAKGSRIIMEKPFGVDLAGAKDLNSKLHKVFDESQIYRIDHFLGKEAAQNILAFRFGNGLFEPIWHRNNIDHIQIDVPEELGLEQRASFYESTGAYKDMVVTHLFQVLGFIALEPPTSLSPDAINEEKNKVFRSMLPIDPGRRRPRSVPGLPRHRGRRARLGDRDLHRAQVLHRQLALGRASRSTSAPASGWRRVRGSSRSRSRSRRGRCSRRTPVSVTTAPTT